MYEDNLLDPSKDSDCKTKITVMNNSNLWYFMNICSINEYRFQVKPSCWDLPHLPLPYLRE